MIIHSAFDMKDRKRTIVSMATDNTQIIYTKYTETHWKDMSIILITSNGQGLQPGNIYFTCYLWEKR